MSDQLLAIPAEQVSCQTKRLNQVKLTYESQEGLTEEQIGKFATKSGKFGWLVFADEPPLPYQLAELPKLKDEGFGKSPSQVLNGKIYRLWQVKKERGESVPEDYETYYRGKMANIANMIEQESL